jgi:hypothetical protein
LNFNIVLTSLLRRFSEAGVEVVLSGEFALSTLAVFRFTAVLDFVILEEGVRTLEGIMTEFGCEKQNFSNTEILSYVLPLE